MEFLAHFGLELEYLAHIWEDTLKISNSLYIFLVIFERFLVYFLSNFL